MIRTPRGTRSVGRGRASVFAQMPVAAELHLVARVGAERFAFPVAQVEEVIDAPDVTWVPLAPAGLLGQLRYRDRTVSAFDGGWALGVAREGTTGSAVVLSEGVRRALAAHVARSGLPAGAPSQTFLRLWATDPHTRGYVTHWWPGDVLRVGPLHGTHDPPFYVCGSDQWVAGYMEGAVRTGRAAAAAALGTREEEGWAHAR